MKKSLVAFIALGLIGLAVFSGLYNKVFTQAALNLSVTHSEAEEIAENYLLGRAYDPSRFKKATVFEVEALPLTFLERTLGVEEYIKTARTDPSLETWHFTTRFFVPLEKEEFLAKVSTRGEVIGFEHLILDTAPGVQLTEVQARELVKNFAENQLKLDLSLYNEKEYHDVRRDNRIDHNFVYELIGSEIKWSEEEGASQGAKRLSFRVQGDEIGQFSNFIFVPEKFDRQLQKEQSLGLALYVAALFLMAIIIIFSIVLLFRYYKAGGLRHRFFIGWAAVLTVLFILIPLTNLSDLFFAYPTSQPLINYLTVAVVGLLIGLVIQAILFLIAALPGERLAAEIYPSANTFTPEKLKDPKLVADSTILGYSLAFAFLGYVTVFYYLATNFWGGWIPIAPQIVGFMASPLPFLVPIVVSLAAAVTEEVTFRLLGVSLLKKYLKFTFLALLIPSIIWAFLHSTYAIMPNYLRGVELTIGGFILAYVFIKYGLLTTIIAHYVMNAVWFSLPLILSTHNYLKFSGLAAISVALLIPLLYTYWSRRRGGVSSSTSLLVQ